MPSHMSREVLIVFGSLTTTDPTNIFDTINLMKDDSIICSVIGLSAEVYICRAIAKNTEGTYTVCENAEHLNKLFSDHITPPTLQQRANQTALITMGFPKQIKSNAFCRCHSTNVKLSFECPQCEFKYCSIPVDCSICGLTLVSSTNLARSYHFLFPVTTIQEIQTKDKKCNGCQRMIEFNTNQCRNCQSFFCDDCNNFIIEVLHNCPGCVAK
eukprot:TRINITY_DN1211_c0_g1_i2.p1 TRINITY_DN1211_c0_g1~~TRINITY_DN1211_c0_g1_i2.p1  ORF type:complete len:213 (+),score=63.72 TRINITY_DN1211_c0_g1_i2:52-690(+)